MSQSKKVKTVFVAHRFEDKEIVRNVKNFEKQTDGVKFTYLEPKAGESLTSNAIDKKIRDGIDKADAVLFANGDNNHNAKWVNREAEVAIAKNKPRINTALPNKNGAPPNKLNEAPYKDAKFKPHDIKQVLHNMATPKSQKKP